MVKTALFCAIVVTFLSCGVVWAEHGGEGEAAEPGLFNGTFGDSLWTVIAFAALVIVLGKFAWKPLLHGLNARQSHIEEQLKAADDSRVKAEHMLDDYKQKGMALVSHATEQAQLYQRQMEEKARDEALNIRRRAHEEIESARAAALADVWNYTGDVVLKVSGEVLGRAITEQDNQRLIDEAVARIRHNGGPA